MRAEFAAAGGRLARCFAAFSAALIAPSVLLIAEDVASVPSLRDYLGPCALVASPEGSRLYVAEAAGRRVDFLTLPGGVVIHSIPVPGEPTGLALEGSGRMLYATCLGPPGCVCAIDTQSASLAFTLAAGHTPCAPVMVPDGRGLYVCNRFENSVSLLDLETRKETARVPAVREPCAAAIHPTRTRLYVANHLPADRSSGRDVAASLTIIDTAAATASHLRLPNGSTSVRDVCVSPDGKYVFVVHILARYQLPTARVDRGWINTNALTILDATADTLMATVLLDEPERGAANPWAAAVAGQPSVLCVALAGTHELAWVAVQPLLEKLAERLAGSQAKRPSPSSGPSLYSFAQQPDLPDEMIRLYSKLANPDIPDDLTFLTGIRHRVVLPGKAPRGIAVAGARIYVAQHFTDDLAVIPLNAGKATGVCGTIPLGPQPTPTPEGRGEMLFHDAAICFQGWQSCASCHPDARSDGLNWDLLNDGLNTPKNTKSLLLAHATPPAMWNGVRASAEDAVRSGVKHVQFADIEEQDAQAIDAYLRSLRPASSPVLNNERHGEQLERGRRLFFRKDVGCAECHPEPLFTDLKSHDVGSEGRFDRRGDFDTPCLVECWRTAPYLHDGRYATVDELLSDGKHGWDSENSPRLTAQEIQDLAAFVLSL